MTAIDFDFAHYVALRKGEVQKRARDGAVYCYSGERKVRRALTSAKPVIIALEATTRLWKGNAKEELLGTAIKATDEQFPKLYAASLAAAKVLGISPPPVYVAPASSKVDARSLGTIDEAYVVINSKLLEHLDDSELVALVGHHLGHVQNNHILYTTALYYLRHSAMMFVRWIVQPAIMTLQAWNRRAEITCDRAALLCTRDLDATIRALVKVSLDIGDNPTLDVAGYLKALESGETAQSTLGRYAEIFRSHPHLDKRIRALRVFAGSRFYKKYTGQESDAALGSEDVDDQVAEILSVF